MYHVALHLAARLQQLRHLQLFDRGVELVDERLHRAVLRLLATWAYPRPPPARLAAHRQRRDAAAGRS